MMWKLTVALLLAVPAPALACSIPPPEMPPTPEEIDREYRADFARIADLVEYVVIKRATNDRKGKIRVTRSYKGAFRPGTVLPIWTLEGSMCGAGDAERGNRGRMVVEGSAPYKYGRMSDDYFQSFVRLGLVPAK